MTQKELFTYTNTVILCELMEDYLTQLKDTPVYRNRIKLNCKELSADIEKVLVIELPKLYAVDEVFTVNLMNEMKDLIHNIAELGGDDIIAISQLIKAFKQDKDKFLDNFQLTLKRLDE